MTQCFNIVMIIDGSGQMGQNIQFLSPILLFELPCFNMGYTAVASQLESTCSILGIL